VLESARQVVKKAAKVKGVDVLARVAHACATDRLPWSSGG
jgi:hypothetical protein